MGGLLRQAPTAPPDTRGTHHVAGADPHDPPAQSPQPAGRESETCQLHRRQDQVGQLGGYECGYVCVVGGGGILFNSLFLCVCVCVV